MSDKPKDRTGADWQTTGQAPFNEKPGPMEAPCGPEKPADEKGHKSVDRGYSDKASEKKGTSVDNTEVGQSSGSPGGRGGASSFGGVERVEPRTKK